MIFRGKDISKCFRKFLGIPDNESRLYVKSANTAYVDSFTEVGVDFLYLEISLDKSRHKAVYLFSGREKTLYTCAPQSLYNTFAGI